MKNFEKEVKEIHILAPSPNANQIKGKNLLAQVCFSENLKKSGLKKEKI